MFVVNQKLPCIKALQCTRKAFYRKVKKVAGFNFWTSWRKKKKLSKKTLLPPSTNDNFLTGNHFDPVRDNAMSAHQVLSSTPSES